jgi:cytochrome c oxidase cbb3-type subunit IV
MTPKPIIVEELKMAHTYAFLAAIAQQLGVIFFMTVFMGIVAYAVWPKNRERFDAAAEIPLKED